MRCTADEAALRLQANHVKRSAAVSVHLWASDGRGSWKQAIEFVSKTALGNLLSRPRRMEAAAANERRDLEIERVRQMMEELRDVVDFLTGEQRWSAEVLDREIFEPSTQTFVEQATTIAIDSRVESKRRLLGRLIAKRLQIDGTDESESLVRSAVTIADALSERQLFALATITFVHCVALLEPDECPSRTCPA